MQTGPLKSYVQNQHLSHSSSIRATEPSLNAENDDGNQNGFQWSSRAILTRALAAEFDVHALPASSLPALQKRMQEYGLIDNQDIGALSVIHQNMSYIKDDNATTGDEQQQQIDAVKILGQMQQQFEQQQVGFQQRQLITRLHTLVQNLSSARAA